MAGTQPRVDDDFVPVESMGSHAVPAEIRVAKALEYIASQMWQIRKEVRRIADKLDAKD